MAKSKKSSKASAPKEVKAEAPKEEVKEEVKRVSILEVQNLCNGLSSKLAEYIVQQQKEGLPVMRLQKKHRMINKMKGDFKQSLKQM